MLAQIAKMCNQILITRYLTSHVRLRKEGMSSQRGHVEKHPTIGDLTQQLAKTMGIERGYRPVPRSRDHLQKLIPTKQTDLPERTMRDSFTVATIPLATNAALQEIMVSITGFVRLSKLLEDMDIFAVIVAQNYLQNPLLGPKDHSPYTIVTALVNRINFTDYQPKLQSDIRMSGHVTWVGSSSIEVIVWLDQKFHNEYNRITKALFLLALRNALNTGSALANPLKITNDQEKKIVKDGDIRKKMRFQTKSQELTKSLPTQEEQIVIHNKFQKTINVTQISLKDIKIPAGGMWMETCILSNIIHAQPVNRNLHNTVFGGFLMRQAADLSYSLTRIFSKRRPLLKGIDDIKFEKPVNMNAMLMMSAHVVYTKINHVQVTVYAQTYDVYANETYITNSFHFTYEVSEVVKDVYPRTYDEAMLYIDGRRHFLDYLKPDEHNPFEFEPIDFSTDMEKAPTATETKKNSTNGNSTNSNSTNSNTTKNSTNSKSTKNSTNCKKYYD